MSTLHQIEELLELETQQVTAHEIVLFNDDVNTFEHVINMLIKVCDHTPEQAEQCSIIVHFNGQCTVKTGELSQLKPQCLQLLDAGLSAKII